MYVNSFHKIFKILNNYSHMTRFIQDAFIMNQRLEQSPEKIIDYREEAKWIVTKNPLLKMVSFNPVEFFRQLTSFQEQSLSKMVDIAAKATKEEIKTRINHKIDNLQKKIALTIKLRVKNQASKR